MLGTIDMEKVRQQAKKEVFDDIEDSDVFKAVLCHCDWYFELKDKHFTYNSNKVNQGAKHTDKAKAGKTPGYSRSVNPDGKRVVMSQDLDSQSKTKGKKQDANT